MACQSPHPDTTPVIRVVQKQQKFEPSGNSQLPSARRRISALAAKSNSFEGWSSIASTIHGQHSTPSSSLNNSGVAVITQHVTSSQSATQQRLWSTPTTMRVISSYSTPAPEGTSQAHSTRRVVSSLPSAISCTPTCLSGPQNLPTSIPNPEACSTISNHLWIQAAETNHRERQSELQPQAVPTPQLVLSGSHSILQIVPSDMTHVVFATGRLMELYMCNRRRFMSASDLGRVSYAMQCVAKALAEAPHWQIIEKYWNTAKQ